MKKLVLLIVIASFLLAACGVKTGTPTQKPQVIEVTRVVVATSAPATVTSLPTWTPLPSNQQVPTLVPTNVISSPAEVIAPVENAQTMPNFTADVSHGAWTIEGTDRLDQNPIVKAWLARLKDPAPEVWKYFPNVPNPDVPEFRVVKCADDPSKECVPDGMEYGTYDSPYCWAKPCDIPVGAREYRYISGDYNFLNLECKGDMKKGCMLVLINVMDQSYTWRSQYVDNGFTVRGLYFNGDALEWGVWGLVSNGAASMLNMPTFSHPGEPLNHGGDSANSGANCGVPSGCQSVDVTVVVSAGDAIIAVAHTVVTP